MCCGFVAMCCVCLMMDISGGGVYRERKPDEPTAVVEATTEPTQIQHTQSVERPTESVRNDYSRGFVHYSISGNVPAYEWEWYLYCKLADRGLEWFYPYAICQIWQESRWNAASTNGRDHGLTQQRGIYWDSRAAQAGIPGADIWDPYAQIHVYVWQMEQYLAAANYSVDGALSIYFLGYAGYAGEYVGHVMAWMDYLEVVQ